MRSILASLLALASTAQAAPAARAPVPPPLPGPPKDAPHTCAANGAPLATIVHRTDEFDKLAQSTAVPRVESSFALSTTGAWNFTQLDAKGDKTREASGCLDDKRLEAMRKELERATWKTERARMTCMAMSPKFTEYYVGGKLRFTARLCQPEHLDAGTQKAVDELERLATDLSKPSPIETSRGKP